MYFLLIEPTLSAIEAIVPMLSSPVSTLMLLVTAFAILYRSIGFSRVPFEVSLLNSAVMNCCCIWMREVSVPPARPCRSRTNASA